MKDEKPQRAFHLTSRAVQPVAPIGEFQVRCHSLAAFQAA
jgi:hypothetical protein